MGMRYRKSSKIGPFRINVSKSGVGWSVGTKGYRYTKTANGRTRTTVSIPGTGLSWVNEQGAKKPNTAQKPHRSLESVPESKVSYRHWPAKYQKEMKWLFISVIPIFLLGITVPVPMLLGVFGLLVWAISFMIRTFIYWLGHRDEFTNDDELDTVVNHTKNIYEPDEAEAERELVEIPTVLPQETSNVESVQEPIHEETIEDMAKDEVYSQSEPPKDILDPQYKEWYLKHERTALMFVDDYTVIDIETTGLNYEKDSIVEVSAVQVRSGEIVDKFQGFNSQSRLSDFLKENSPITQEDIDGGINLEELLSEFLKFIGSDVLVGHNLGFDLSFLRTKLHYYDLGDLINPFIDTMLIGKYYANKNWRHHRVEDYISRYRAKVGGLGLMQHSAYNDVLYEQRIYELQRSILGEDFFEQITPNMVWALPKVRVVETEEEKVARINAKKMIDAIRIAIDDKDYNTSNILIQELFEAGVTDHSKLYKRMAMNYKKLRDMDKVVEVIDMWEDNMGPNISKTDKDWIEKQRTY